MGRSLKTEGIVLRKLRYGEADSILGLYTNHFGRVGAIAKGVRRSRSRFGGRLEPFFRVDLVLHEGRGELLTVTSVETVDAHPQLRSSAEALDTASKAADFVLRLFDERERNDPAYNLTANLLALLDRDPTAAGTGIGLAFRAKLLLAAGFAPEITQCVHCGATEGLVGFSAADGGIVCADCRQPNDFAFDAAANAFLTAAVASPLAELPDATPAALRAVDRAINETLGHHAQVRMRGLT